VIAMIGESGFSSAHLNLSGLGMVHGFLRRNTSTLGRPHPINENRVTGIRDFCIEGVTASSRGRKRRTRARRFYHHTTATLFTTSGGIHSRLFLFVLSAIPLYGDPLPLASSVLYYSRIVGWEFVHHLPGIGSGHDVQLLLLAGVIEEENLKGHETRHKLCRSD
jgi:hypothetical protein